ncbi:MAG TPA: hypothetical protein VKB47_06295 [Terracidiphilus sp.]|nr:hypothetical protein [Terracidiphilus sp.]
MPIPPDAKKVLDEWGIHIVKSKHDKEILVTDDPDRLIPFGNEKIRLGDVQESLKEAARTNIQAEPKLGDAVILRPSLWGMGIDLPKAWKWMQDKWRRPSRL